MGGILDQGDEGEPERWHRGALGGLSPDWRSPQTTISSRRNRRIVRGTPKRKPRFSSMGELRSVINASAARWGRRLDWFFRQGACKMSARSKQTARMAGGFYSGENAWT